MTTPMIPDRVSALRVTDDLVRACCAAAIEAWRLGRVVSRLCEEDQARVRMIADRLHAGLTQASVTTEDRTGQCYEEGLSVEVLATEERPELAQGVQQIVEVVKPSVYVAGRLAVMGQVIVGRGVRAEERQADGARDD